jgi:hypothetical protein
MNRIQEQKITLYKPETRHIYNCCGFVSVFNGMKCEAPEILLQYEIENISDLLELLVYGNDKHPSIYNMFLNNEEGQDMLTNLSKKITRLEWYKILKIQQTLFEKNKDILYTADTGVSPLFFVFVSLYFKIHFRLFYKQDCEKAFNYSKWLDKYVFIKEIPIMLVNPIHVEFEPNYDKKMEPLKFELLKKLNKYQENQILNDQYSDEMLKDTDEMSKNIDYELQRYTGLTKEEKEKEDDSWNIQIKELNDLLLIIED